MNDGDLTPLGMSAAVMHETYQALMAVGFTETQAVYLIGFMVGGAKPV